MGCRRVAPADELVRFVRLPDGTLAQGQALPGRGAWLCREGKAPVSVCVEAAVRRKALGRALRGEIRPEAVDLLREIAADRARMGSSTVQPGKD